MSVQQIPGSVFAGDGSTMVGAGYGKLGVSPFSGTLVCAVEANPKYVGFVIGHKGHYINFIKQTTGAWVQIRDPQPEYGRTSVWFEVQGYPHQVEAATQKVQKALSDALARDHSKTVVSDEWPPINAEYGEPVPPTDEELDEAATHLEKFEADMEGGRELLSLQKDIDVVSSPSYQTALEWGEAADLAIAPNPDGSMSEFDHSRMDGEEFEMNRDADAMTAPGDIWYPPLPQPQMAHMAPPPQMAQMVPQPQMAQMVPMGFQGVYGQMPPMGYGFPGVYGQMPQFYGQMGPQGFNARQ